MNQSAPRSVWRLADIPAWIVSFCTLFNFLYCFLQTNVVTIPVAGIMATEMLLVSAAAAFGFFRLDRRKFFWLAVLAADFLLFAALSLAKDEMLIKPLRDLMIVPIFVSLGLASAHINFSKHLLALTSFVTVVALWEAAMPTSFLQIFNFKEFHIAKGSMSDTPVVDLDTFTSGVRPGGRFLFDVPGIHRISSVFTEPVSLGFFACIVVIYAISVRRSVSALLFSGLMFMSFLLIWLSDGRMALGTALAVILFHPVFRRLDHRLSVLIFPIIMIVAWMAFGAGWLVDGGEGMSARLYSTMTFFSEISLAKFFGLGVFDHYSVDTAAGYLLENIGAVGLAIFWLAPVFFLGRLPEEARIYIWGVSIYIAMAFMLSAAIFTIKTAALLWFAYGYLIVRPAYLERMENSSEATT